MANKLNILVPIGFSDQSIMALDQALVFAEAAPDAHLTLLTVIEEDGFFKRVFGAKKNTEELRKKVDSRIKELADEYRAKCNFKIETIVAKGLVYEEIARVVEMMECNLVVMGTNGKPQNLRRRFIGSNAYRTASLVQPPVVAVKGIRRPQKVETIIFPLVLDRRSKEKVGPAIHYAKLFNAQIKIVSVLQVEDEAKIVRAHLHQVDKFISDKGIACTTELIENPQHKGVVRNTLEYAYENDGDLLIITEDDRERDITDYFLGTDVQAVMYHSEIPVMSITPSEVKWEALWEAF